MGSKKLLDFYLSSLEEMQLDYRPWMFKNVGLVAMYMVVDTWVCENSMRLKSNISNVRTPKNIIRRISGFR